MWSLPSIASPDLASISAGSVSVSQNQSQTLIQQPTDRAILNWNNFDIASDHHVIFQQPNAASFTLNRIPSFLFSTFIDGRITANGTIAVINPQGIIIGPTSVIQTGGFIASTHDILDGDVMDADNILNFNFSPALASTISHQGRIEVGGDGKIVIQAPRIEMNGGRIQGNRSLITLTTADSVTMDLSQGLNQLNLVLSGGDIDIQNSSIINSAENDINIISGDTIALNDNLIQSSGGDINFESVFGDIFLNNNVIASKGALDSGNIDIETFANDSFYLGSSENFLLLPENNISEGGEGGDITIRSAQIFGDQNCIQSGNITCLYQNQPLSFRTDNRPTNLTKQAQKVQNNIEEKTITFLDNTEQGFLSDEGGGLYLDIQINDILSTSEE
jgi:filamentous hemagglutinin family protein